jgi:hypothetical protein
VNVCELLYEEVGDSGNISEGKVGKVWIVGAIFFVTYSLFSILQNPYGLKIKKTN